MLGSFNRGLSGPTRHGGYVIDIWMWMWFLACLAGMSLPEANTSRS
jgi:hypothetical protein